MAKQVSRKETVGCIVRIGLSVVVSCVCMYVQVIHTYVHIELNCKVLSYEEGFCGSATHSDRS